MSLTSAGLTIKRLSDIQSDLSDAMKTAFGASTNTDSDSVIGQLIGVFAGELAPVYELAQQLYDSFDPDQAEGTQLDNVAALVGITRLVATNSSATLTLTGTAGTLIPTASIVATNDSLATQFQTTADATLTLTTLVTGNLTFISAAKTVTRASGSWTTDLVFPGMKVSFSGTADNDGTFEVASIDTGGTVLTFVDSVSVTDEGPVGGVTTTIVVAQASSSAVVAGALAGVSGSLTDIVTPVAGWNSVYNFEDALVGQNTETDLELRIRREASLQLIGASVDFAIRAAVLTVPGVVEASVISNRTDALVDGIEPHAFETVVWPDTGDPTYQQNIAETIFLRQPAGILADGSSTFNVTDSQGFVQQVSYTFATEIDMYIVCDVTTNSEYPSDGNAQVAAALLAEGNLLGVGDDVLLWKFIASLDPIAGITDVAVYIQSGGFPVPPAGNSNIGINFRQIARFDSGRINVI